MNFKILVHVALVYLFSWSKVLADMKKAYFRQQSVASQFNGTIYKRIVLSENIAWIRETQPIRCALNCLDEDDCYCFYIEDKACVWSDFKPG